jgi:adenosylcobinamide kinase / adenosylcobinamide-phosphate guanylyltransferase
VEGGPLLVDCLTLWLTRVMDRHDAWDDDAWATRAEKAVATEIDELVAAWRSTTRRVVAVSNEVGQGVVPATASGRRFRDLMGRLNARVAAESEDVRWCVAGRVSAL